jgi:lactam utilization protein B
VFEAALDVLRDRNDMTQAKLVKELQNRGALPPGKHDAKYFFAQLKAFCQEHGLEARAGVTRAESFLCANDFGERLNFVTRIKKQMKDKGYSLSDLVFMDETSVNATNHPKCE